MQDNDTKEGPDINDSRESIRPAEPTADVATILSRLPASGTEDDVARLMDIYEAAERSYRASIQAHALRVSSAASTNRQ